MSKLKFKNVGTGLAGADFTLEDMTVIGTDMEVNLITANSLVVRNSTLTADVTDKYGVGTGVLSFHDEMLVENSQLDLKVTNAKGQAIAIGAAGLNGETLVMKDSTAKLNANGSTGSCGIRMYPFSANNAKIAITDCDVTIHSKGSGILMTHKSDAKEKDELVIDGNSNVTITAETNGIYSYNNTAADISVADKANLNIVESAKGLVIANGQLVAKGLSRVVVYALTSATADDKNFDLTNYGSSYSLLTNADMTSDNAKEWDTETSLTKFKYVQLLPKAAVKIEDPSKVYDAKAVEVVYTKNSSANAVVEYKAKDAEDDTYTDKAPVVAGEYTVRVTVDANEDYIKTVEEQDFTISPYEVEIQPASYTKVYGTTDEEMTYTIGKLVNDETLTDLSISRESGEDVGTYAITVTQNEGANPNYRLAVKEATYTITQADPNLAVEEVADKKYGDAAFALVTSFKGDGKVTYTSKDTNIVTVDDAGMVTPQEAGTTQVVVSLAETRNYVAAEKTVTITVVPLSEEGVIRVDIRKDEKAPETSLAVTKDELEESVLTIKERDKVKKGISADIWIEVKDATDTITTKAKNEIELSVSNHQYQIGRYIDISLLKLRT